ncbi:hypothetical protein EMIHUDRAFT_315396 [Emiliania huxleyi CCMP1516]|uniref:G-protein coupled receptors family 1 profile domain-containing protein n=2 Tax=Emiliania huxleyi TaxID=2903 RepID=A0A0D3JMW1_EMIH1|nr:hypothetical protein EMIHUDRAFT_315396 [Emiliania huxleyi CCMP1516]EOD24846.1 hypothetical protein EMIHUDRAFT_315396 [Emiliania huxleyi CCMP1516]|eukprot:XP_005777275.1 hypothetical protein EMIHUDRAFT_315396 [Emiliania huxleyi CCMP1516]
MRLIQLLFLLFLLALPLLFLLCLALLWAAPLQPRTQRRLLVATEVVHAWSAPDVFVLTIVASSLELDRFAHFIIGHECDAIDAAARRYRDVFASYTADDEAEGCAGIRVRILPGTYVFVVAVLAWNAVGALILHCANSAAASRGGERGSGAACSASSGDAAPAS